MSFCQSTEALPFLASFCCRIPFHGGTREVRNSPPSNKLNGDQSSTSLVSRVMFCSESKHTWMKDDIRQRIIYSLVSSPDNVEVLAPGKNNVGWAWAVRRGPWAMFCSGLACLIQHGPQRTTWTLVSLLSHNHRHSSSHLKKKKKNHRQL